MGEVYRARDPRLGRDVAVKVLSGDVSGSPERLRRFEQEARAVAALEHPGILAVHDVGAHEGRAYVVFELLEGETLASVSRGVRSPCARRSSWACRWRRPSPRRTRGASFTET
jgi:serine/threonine protein kinase